MERKARIAEEHDESRESLQPTSTDETRSRAKKKRLTVKWIDINNAMDACYELEVITPNASIVLPNPQEESGKGLRRLKSEGEFLKQFNPDEKETKTTGCFGCFQFLFTKQNSPDNGPVDGNAGFYGYVWKCNSDQLHVGDPAGLTDLSNWRRRLFFLRDHRKDGRMLAYVSEKDNGSLQVCACLSGSNTATIKKLPKVTLKKLTDPEKLQVRLTLFDYDIAFWCVDPRGSSDEDYVEEVPTDLWPFTIEWTDSSGERHSVLLSVHRPREVDEWIEYLNGKELPMELTEEGVRASWDQAVSVKYGDTGKSGEDL